MSDSNPPPDPPDEARPDSRSKPPAQQAALTVYGAVGYTLLTLFVALLVLDLSSLVRPGLSRDLVNNQLCFALAFSLGIYFVVRFHLPGRSLADALGARPSPAWVYVVALLTGLTLQLPITWLDGLVEGLAPRTDEELAGIAGLFVFRSTWHKVLVAAAATTLGPFLEEMLCRGALFRAMRLRSSTAVVVTASAACFALLHLSLRDMGPVFVSGLALGALRAVSGSVVPALVAHMAFNGVTVFCILAGIVRMGERTPAMPWYHGTAGLAGVGLLLYVAHALARRSPAVQAATAGDAS